MRIITRKRLNEFASKHPETTSALEHWYRLMKQREFASLAELRTVFPDADPVGKVTVFNIGGNKARLIAAIHYNRHFVDRIKTGWPTLAPWLQPGCDD
jgi:mRNA interferase HigB